MNLKRASLAIRLALVSMAIRIIRATTDQATSHHSHRQHVQRSRRLQEQDDSIQKNYRRMLSAGGGGVQMSAVYYARGTYYADLWCGTPPQRRSLVVDTGGSWTAFPCSECKDCGSSRLNQAFDEYGSTTFEYCREDHCRIDIEYSEESRWSAFFSRDVCYLGGPHLAPLRTKKVTESIDPNRAKALSITFDFGCQTSVGSFFKSQLADGYLGMDDSSRSFWFQLLGKGRFAKQFSLCLARPVGFNRTEIVAGAITLGGTDTRLHKSPMVFATRMYNPKDEGGPYQLKVRRVYMRHGQGGESARSIYEHTRVFVLSTPEEQLGAAIVDSSSPDTFFNQVIAAEFRAAFESLSAIEFHHGEWELDKIDLEMLPTVLIQLVGSSDLNNNQDQSVGLAGDLDPDHPQDVILAIPASHYMELLPNGKYTPRIHNNNKFFILGTQAMMGHNVLFDMDRQVIGWAESDCDYQKLVIGSGYRNVLEAPLPKENKEEAEESEDEDRESDSHEDDESGDSDEEIRLNSESQNVDPTSNSNSFHPLNTATEGSNSEFDSNSSKKENLQANWRNDNNLFLGRVPAITLLLLVGGRWCIKSFCRNRLWSTKGTRSSRILG